MSSIAIAADKAEAFLHFSHTDRNSCVQNKLNLVEGRSDEEKMVLFSERVMRTKNKRKHFFFSVENYAEVWL